MSSIRLTSHLGVQWVPENQQRLREKKSKLCHFGR